ncbi:MAG: histidinol-phosphate transaminase [Planctomycetes bacterium]|nr:histidinol-phosphate transaminase [Planctomycetota bacterium]
MPRVRDCVRTMTGYIPGTSTDDPQVVKLNQNENRYPPSPQAIRAIEATLAGLAVYPESTSPRLRETAADIYQVDPAEVMATNGSDEMLRILFQACCDPGDEVVAFQPSYTYYETLAAMQDAKYRPIPFADGFALPAHLDLAGVKLVFLPNPNAPTGTVFPEAEIRRLAAAVTDGLLVVDEAYADFSGQTAIPLIREYDNLVVVRTFSKSYSLAGLRVGLGFLPRDLAAQLEKVRDYYNLDRLAQAGAEAALRDQDYLRSVVDRIVATRQRTARELAALGVTVYDSGANFLLLRLAGREAAESVFRHLYEHKVYVRYFRSPGLDDCLRVSIGTDQDMDAFLAAFRQALRLATE